MPFAVASAQLGSVTRDEPRASAVVDFQHYPGQSVQVCAEPRTESPVIDHIGQGRLPRGMIHIVCLTH